MSKTQWVILAAVACVAVALSTLLSRAEKPGAARAGYPQRIVCMAPNIGETLFALGVGDRVVGVSDYTVYPPEATKLPTVGAQYNADLEKIASLKPDLVIVQEKHEKVEQLCAERGIEVMRVRMLRVESILEGVRQLGDRLGVPENAVALQKKIQADLAAVRARVQGLPRVDVFLCVGRTPGSPRGLFAIGGTSFLNELIKTSGGRNVYEDIQDSYPQVSAESLIQLAPQVIIETYPSQKLSEEQRKAIIADWSALPKIPAVRDGRVILLTEDFLVVPGPRIGLIAERLADVLHPKERS